MSEAVFDDVVQGTTLVYSDPRFNEAMGKPDSVMIVFYAFQWKRSSGSAAV